MDTDLRPIVHLRFNCINNSLLLVTMHARRKSEVQTDDISEMNPINAQRASSLQFTIAQNKAVWPSILSDCKRPENSAGEKAVAQELTIGVTEEEECLVVTRSWMRDRTMACFCFLLNIHHLNWETPSDDANVEIESYDGGALESDLSSSWNLVVMEGE